MATQLKSGFSNNGLMAKQILKNRGKMLTSGFMDEIDAEAERHANAIRHARELTPAKIVRKSGFGRPQYHPNASRNNFAMVD